MDKVIISDEQAVEFLNSIWSDISAYISSHMDEYQKFLESEGIVEDTET